MALLLAPNLSGPDFVILLPPQLSSPGFVIVENEAAGARHFCGLNPPEGNQGHR